MSCFPHWVPFSVPTESSPTWPKTVEALVSTNLRLSHATGEPLQNSLARRRGVKLPVAPVFVGPAVSDLISRLWYYDVIRLSEHDWPFQ